MENQKRMIHSVSVLLCAALLLSSCGTLSHVEASATTVTVESVSQTVPLTEAVEHTAETSAATVSAPQVSATQPSTQVSETTMIPATTTVTETTTAPVTTTATETTATTTVPTPPPDNSERDALFADRVRTPYTVVKMAGNVKYTVTFDREEYYWGDDINLRVKAENVGTESIIILKPSDCELKEVIQVQFCVSDIMASDYVTMGYNGTQQDTAPTVFYWEPGMAVEEVGRRPTSTGGIYEASKLSVLIDVGGSHYVEIPLTIHWDVPTDSALQPYYQNGDIDYALYRRANMMNDKETIPVVIPQSWDWEKLLPDMDPQPIFEAYGTSDAVAHLTRAQLLAMLEYQAPLNSSEREALKYIYTNSWQKHKPDVYPIDGV